MKSKFKLGDLVKYHYNYEIPTSFPSQYYLGKFAHIGKPINSLFFGIVVGFGECLSFKEIKINVFKKSNNNDNQWESVTTVKVHPLNSNKVGTVEIIENEHMTLME